MSVKPRRQIMLRSDDHVIIYAALFLVCAMLSALGLGALLATLATGLLTAMCFVPAVLLSEMLSRRAGGYRPPENGPAL